MPGRAQKTLKIFMVPKFTGTAYFAATEKGAEEAVAELKSNGVAIDFLYTGPRVANTDEEIRMIDDMVAQKPDAIIIAPNNADAWWPWPRRPRRPGSRSSPMMRTWPIPPRASGS
jgi:rhamnose transport system substrate-binding protein